MAFFKVISVKSQRWKWLVLFLVHIKANSVHPGTTCGEPVPLRNVIILFFPLHIAVVKHTDSVM